MCTIGADLACIAAALVFGRQNSGAINVSMASCSTALFLADRRRVGLRGSGGQCGLDHLYAGNPGAGDRHSESQRILRDASLCRQHLLRHRHREGLVQGRRHHDHARAQRLEDHREPVGVAAAEPAGRHQLGDVQQSVALLQEHRSAEVRRVRRHLLGLGDVRQPEARVEAARRLHDPRRDACKEGLAEALKPLLGKTVYIPPSISEKEFTEVPFKLAGLDLPNYVTMEDLQMLLLAKSGRLDFMHPAGAPIAQTLLDAGWTPIYDSAQLLKFGPGGVDSPFEPLVFNNGWAATADYIDGHKTTMMRFASVVFRIFDALKKDPSLYGVFAPYLNSVAGTSLDADGVRRTVEHWIRSSRSTSRPNISSTRKARNITAIRWAPSSSRSKRPAPFPPASRRRRWSGRRRCTTKWRNTRKSPTRCSRRRRRPTLSADKQALLAKAHQFYDWDDFLDSYRLATAAMAK